MTRHPTRRAVALGLPAAGVAGCASSRPAVSAPVAVRRPADAPGPRVAVAGRGEGALEGGIEAAFRGLGAAGGANDPIGALVVAAIVVPVGFLVGAASGAVDAPAAETAEALRTRLAALIAETDPSALLVRETEAALGAEVAVAAPGAPAGAVLEPALKGVGLAAAGGGDLILVLDPDARLSTPGGAEAALFEDVVQRGPTRPLGVWLAEDGAGARAALREGVAALARRIAAQTADALG